jgi:hypothetical protein
VLVHGVELPLVDAQLTIRHLLFVLGGGPPLSYKFRRHDKSAKVGTISKPIREAADATEILRNMF